MKTKEAEEDFSFFDLNQNKLDEEWVRQPQLYYKYAALLADARAEQERAKNARDLCYADLDGDIRSHPDKYELQKVTDTSVENAIIRCEDYQEAVRRLIKAKHRADQLYAVVSALDHRKEALESLVRLFGQNYFSTPVANGELREEMIAAEAVSAFDRRKRHKGLDRD